MFNNNCCLCYMHRSKSFAIIIRPHPNLAYHIHGPSKSTPAIWSVKMQVCQNPGPSKSTLAIWSAKIQSFKFRALKFFGPSKSSPANSVTPLFLRFSSFIDLLYSLFCLLFAHFSAAFSRSFFSFSFSTSYLSLKGSSIIKICRQFNKQERYTRALYGQMA